ncbi:tetratricopeptide repeat protein [Thermodesulfobacteriota bacterium]
MRTTHNIKIIVVTCIAFLSAPAPCFPVAGPDLSSDARAVLHEAQDLMEENRVSEAVVLLERYQKAQKNCGRGGKPATKGTTHHLISFTMGNGLLILGRHSEALAHYRDAVEQEPGFSAAWLNLGKTYYELCLMHEAGESFLRGYELSSEKKAETLYHAGAAFLAAGEASRAAEVFEGLLSTDQIPVEREWTERIAYAFFESKQHQKALPLIETLAARTEGSRQRQWQEVLLNLYLSLDMNQEALASARRLAELEPQEPRWWSALARCYIMDKRDREALVAITAYSFLTPPSPDEMKLMAHLNLALGIPREAVRWYERIPAKDLDMDTIKKAAGSHRLLGQFDRALEWVGKGLKQKPDGELWGLEGALLYESDMYEEALEAFTNAARLGPDAGRAWLMAGYAALKAERLNQARRAFENAAAYPVQKTEALKLLGQLELRLR